MANAERNTMHLLFARLSDALERYRRKSFLEALDQDFRSSPDYASEVENLDGTAADGLEGLLEL